MVMAAFLHKAAHRRQALWRETRVTGFLADKDVRITRVQVKSGWLRRGVVTFSCKSSHYVRWGEDYATARLAPPQLVGLPL